MPFENHLKLEVAERHADGVTVHFPLSPEFLNSQGVLHGGITATVADEAAWHAIEHHFGKPTNCTTTELKVNYLRPIVGDQSDRPSLPGPRRKNVMRLAHRYLRRRAQAWPQSRS